MPNRLGDSPSPYLRQHRDNPVDWHPWSPEAFDEARRRDVPVLLSIGYSACHWCHVMAHESFEDDEVAAVMNRDFVNIKVDREERPDVDAVYMDAVQAMTGRGGWPMTVFLTPDARPFYGGTYFPRTTFLRLLDAITETWNDRRGDAAANAEALMEALRAAGSMPAGGASHPPEPGADDEILERTTGSLLAKFDPVWGGFGGAPKFPPTFALEHLIRRAVDAGDRSAEDAVLTTLDAMAAGGIHDHIGGGFSRYSVDDKWIVPHFEKMLYDQALIGRAYLHSWQAFGVGRHLEVLRSTMQYLLSVLRSPEGGFYCAEDADSLDSSGHSHEGAFYTWTPDEVHRILGDDGAAACALWGIDTAGNFEGRSIPVRIHGGPVPDGVADLRARLAAARDLRPRPGLDDKILTEWTAMALSTLAEAAGAFGDREWTSAAVDAANFLVSKMRRPDGRWMRVWHRDAAGASLLATAHDLAHAVDALTRTYELTGDSSWVARALEAADILVLHHWDPADPGFFTVADDGEQLVVRAKDYLDNAVPSANSAAAIALARLGALTGRHDLRALSDAVLDRLADVGRRAPTATTNLALARHLRRDGITEVVICGDRPDLVAEVRSGWRPDVVLAWGGRFDSPLWEGRNDDRAYVCREYVCMAPAATVEELRAALSAARPTR